MTVEDMSLTVQRAPIGLPAGLSMANGFLSVTNDVTEPVLSSGPGARSRILTTASRLFYLEGIRAVGIDRLISESCVTKATFYKHFGAKDTLILAYIGHAHDVTVALLTQIENEAKRPADAIRSIIECVLFNVQSEDFRGCTFINAAVEFPGRDHPVRQLVLSHRDWYTAFVAELLREAGHPMPGDAADELVLLRDGAMMGGYTGDHIAASAALGRFGERVLADLPA